MAYQDLQAIAKWTKWGLEDDTIIPQTDDFGVVHLMTPQNSIILSLLLEDWKIILPELIL